MSAEREMLEAAARAIGLPILFENDGSAYSDWNGLPWAPHQQDADSFRLAAALRISVEHNHAEEIRPWVCASIDGGPLRMRKAFVEDVPDESQRADRMRLAILRCAAAQAPENGCNRTDSDASGCAEEAVCKD